MSGADRPRVAVVGTGEIGQGWAALIVAGGWRVAVYDPDSAALTAAAEAIPQRVRALVDGARARQSVAYPALEELRIGRSLLQALTDADWIIEAAPEDLGLKQKLLEQIEQVSRLASVLTSSASALHASDLCARLRRPDRFLVTHPLNPVELIPVVEVVPGPRTDAQCVEDVRWWLHELGRTPVVLRKEVAGNVTGRLAAAVWRECIQLVLDGVVDPAEVDQLMSRGPALGWAAAGPFLNHRLAGGAQPPAVTVSRLLRAMESLWSDLAGWHQLEPDQQHRLIRAVEHVYQEQLPALRRERDQRLARLLAADDRPS